MWNTVHSQPTISLTHCAGIAHYARYDLFNLTPVKKVIHKARREKDKQEEKKRMYRLGAYKPTSLPFWPLSIPFLIIFGLGRPEERLFAKHSENE
jgi:hypothetical protein